MRVVRKALFTAILSSFLLVAPLASAEPVAVSPSTSSEPGSATATPPSPDAAPTSPSTPAASTPTAATAPAATPPAATAPAATPPAATAPASTPPAATAPAAPAPVPATPAPTYATPQEAAQAAYTEGEALYREGQYAEAEAAFIRAYRAVPTSTTLIAIAESRAHQGFGPEAVDVFERYLRVAPTAPDADAVRHRIEELRASPGILRIATTPEGARVSVDGVASEHLTPTDVEVAPGSHQIRVELEGYEPMEGSVEVRFASVVR